jgi:competence protein ComEA
MRTLQVVCWSIVSLLALALRPGQVAGAPAALVGVVNINTASTDELELLPGVGPARARLIVEYRGKHPFRTVEELARIKGIGPRTVRRLRANLVVHGPTTAQNQPGARGSKARARKRRGHPDAVSAAGGPPG